MGEHNKLLLPVDDKPMVAHVVDALAAAGVAPIVVVTGHQSEAVRAALGDRPVEFVHNPDHPQGMGTSLRTGALALRPRAVGPEARFSGVLVCLADMPRLRAHHLARLRDAFAPAAGRDICVPTFERKRGNPVLFGTAYLDELTLLEGDVGARELLARHAERVALVPMADEGVLLDVDTPDALRALADRGAKGA
jgi:molybdenum cofactor cytidylyltransferase